jgi:2-polyprenyl-3-methyl-5-hydroxy-6-metoxy-1,4-benzoquinol methylase
VNRGVPDARGLWRALSQLSDDEWLEVMLRSIREPRYAGFDLPRVPPDDFQRRYNGQAGEANIQSAFDFYKIVKAGLARCGGTLSDDSRVLDFGCGWGRITRLFLKDVLGDNLYGIDVDTAAIDMCQQTLGYGTFEVNHAAPPTTFQTASFDLVVAYSVFSHLAEPAHLQWLAECARILKGGGVLVVTTLKRSFLKQCQAFRQRSTLEHGWQRSAAESFVDAAAALADYDSGKYLFSPRPSGDYGMSVIPRAYVEKAWTPFLEFQDFIDEQTVLPQAVVVMRKARPTQ